MCCCMVAWPCQQRCPKDVAGVSRGTVSFWALVSKVAMGDSEDNVAGHQMTSGIDFQVASPEMMLWPHGEGSVRWKHRQAAAGDVCGQHLFYHLSADQRIWQNKTK